MFPIITHQECKNSLYSKFWGSCDQSYVPFGLRENETVSQASSQMEIPSWWVTPVFVRWGWRRTRVTWPLQWSSTRGTVTLHTHGKWKTWAPMVQAGARLWVIMPPRPLRARGCTSPRVNWGPAPSGGSWCSTEEEGSWLIWGQIYKIPAGGHSFTQEHICGCNLWMNSKYFQHCLTPESEHQPAAALSVSSHIILMYPDFTKWNADQSGDLVLLL